MPTKAEAIKAAGIGNRQAYDLQAMAANPDVVQAVLDKAEAKRKHDANGGDKKSEAFQESASQNSDAPKVRTDEQLAKLATPWPSKCVTGSAAARRSPQ